jgi:hypothetical protein
MEVCVVYRFIIQLGIGVVFFLFSTLATWYEGSEILDRPFEWKFSTPFSGIVLKASDISPLDYFVYAIKFKPTFPAIAVLSCIYLFIVIGYYVFPKRNGVYTSFLSIIAALLLGVGCHLFSSTTEGAQFMSYIFLLSGVLCLVAGLLYYIYPLGRRQLSFRR